MFNIQRRSPFNHDFILKSSVCSEKSLNSHQYSLKHCPASKDSLFYCFIVFQLTYAALVDKLIQQEKLNHCDGRAIQHPSQNPTSCLMMDNDDAWMYYHDGVVEQIDLNSMVNATESICSAVGFKLGKSWEAYVTELHAKYCRGPVFTSLLWNLMLSSRVMIFKAVFYTLYTTDQMDSNGRISVIKQ